MRSSEVPLVKPLVSVVVCTYNRSLLLAGCLDSLARQCVDKNRFEVVVIDNNSSDNTCDEVRKYCELHNNFRVVREERQGLACARNRGWQEAKGAYVAYVDDDARAASDWVGAICSFIGRMPHIDAFGGPYMALYASRKPEWYKDEYGSWSLGEVERPLCDKEHLNGTNMIFKKTVFAEVGGFAENLGMVGATISYGEETNFDRKLKAAGKKLYYSPTIVVDHLVFPHKMSLEWMLSAVFKNGLAGPITFEFERNISKALVRLFVELVIGVKRAVFTRETHIQNRIYEALRGVVWQTGVLVAMIRQCRDDFKTTR